VGVLSSEEETRKLLKIREDLEKRMARFQVEVEDLRRAIAEIDRSIVRQGFRQPVPALAGARPSADEDEEGEDRSSVKSKDGITLGFLRTEEEVIVFEPLAVLGFTTVIPPFQSFFVERVLDNMRSTDEGRVEQGELSPDDVLSYEVATEGDRITGITIRNYGGERRLMEIRSSLRWAFEKMYEKLGQG
jgi:hypothetical protein